MKWRWLGVYFGAVTAVIIASALTYALRSVIEPNVSLLFFPAIVIPAMYGGYGPALVATVLSTASLAYFFVPPNYSFSIGADDALRLAVFLIVACATAWLGSERRRAESAQRRSLEELQAAVRTLRKVSGWPLSIGADTTASIRRMLKHAATVVTSRTAIVTWESDDEPWVYVGTSDDVPAVTKLSPAESIPMISEFLGDTSFVCLDVQAEQPVFVSERGVMPEWRGGDVIHLNLQSRIGVGPMASAPFQSEHLSGRVFFPGLPNANPDIIPVVQVVAREVGNSLDQLHLADRLRQVAVQEERIRVSRDLHDGVLQAMTGIRLELQSIAQESGSPPLWSDRLLAIERAIAIEQRQLRLFIQELKPSSAGLVQFGPIGRRLEEMCARLRLEWQTSILIHVRPSDLSLLPTVEEAIRLMVHEAVVNALKHAHPSRVSVNIDAIDSILSVIVADDGRGFSFHGTFDHAELIRMKSGPISLCERVTELNGRLTIESTAKGSRLEFAIPISSQRA